MKTRTKSIIIHSTPEKVFAYMDSLGNTGMHMTQSNMPMMGGKLELKQLSQNRASCKIPMEGKCIMDET